MGEQRQTSLSLHRRVLVHNLPGVPLRRDVLLIPGIPEILETAPAQWELAGDCRQLG